MNSIRLKTGLVRPSQKCFTLFSVILLVIALGGCQEQMSKNESISFWPILNSEKTFHRDDDGTAHRTDTGSAFLIAHWDKSVELDKMGNMIQRKEFVSVWPLFDSHETQDPTSKHSKGTILLLFRYDRLLTMSESAPVRDQKEISPH